MEFQGSTGRLGRVETNRGKARTTPTSPLMRGVAPRPYAASLDASARRTVIRRAGRDTQPVAERRFEVKRLILLVAMLATLGVTLGNALAAVDPPRVPPKGIEGPDVQ